MSLQLTVLGSGSFGTTIAHIYAKSGHSVTLWGRDPDVIGEIATAQTNQHYLPDCPLAQFRATTDLELALQACDIVLLALPTQALRVFLQTHKDLLKNTAIINLAKGIEIDSLKTPSQIVHEILGEGLPYGMLSGPTFARELWQEMPSGAVIATNDAKLARHFQAQLSTKRFRLYTSDDVIGVELGGACKNVMAIGVGIAEGLGFGLNTRAGLIPRCLHEMTELGIALGARARTFSGLSGLGDLILTCTGDLSRNRQVGLRLGRGETVHQVRQKGTHVAEGVTTAKSLYQLMNKHQIDMPNAEHVYRILYENMPVRDAVEKILKRSLKAEYLDE